MNLEDLERLISVTPNPFNDYFKIEGLENDLVELYDLSGKKIKHRINNNIINTENLKRGVYILVFKEKNISFKLIKS